MSSAEECPVCCEQYTKQHRKKVECAHCQTACCSGCLQQYLLTLQSDAQCMGCKRAFDGEFLSMHLPKTWLLGRYKAHREKVLLDREMALLPGSQDLLANYRQAQHLQAQITEWETEKRQLQQRLYDVTRELSHGRNALAVVQRNNYTQRPADQQQSATAAQERRQFIRACPMDGCRGFLSTAWRCGTCETWVCKDCGEPKLEGQRDEQHVCNPDVAASHALLQRDTRPCPQCAAMIFKQSGCDQVSGRRREPFECVCIPTRGCQRRGPDRLVCPPLPQMWCTQCNVAFSWRTGAVVTNGVIHNPHYYEWLRRTRGEVPRNAGDVPCGGLPGAYELDAVLRRSYSSMSVDDVSRLRGLHRALRHVQHVDIPRLRREADGGGEFQRNADLRLKYLLNQIDEEEWRRKLQRREKKREHAFSVMQVYDMFSGAATDTFRALVSGAQTPKDSLAELQQLQSFANESLDNIAKRFNMAAKRLRWG